MKTAIELPTGKDIEHYKKLRKVGIELNSKLFRDLSREAILECAKKLGVAKFNRLTIGCDDELAVLTDYCLFHYRKNKTNVISRYLLMTPPEKDSLEMEILTAMEKSYYSIFIIKAFFENKGVLVFDLSTGQDIFIIDLNLSKSGIIGLMLACNVVPIGRFYRTSGILVPLPPEYFEQEIKPIAEKFLSENNMLSPAKQALFAAHVIRIALKDGAMNSVGSV